MAEVYERQSSLTTSNMEKLCIDIQQRKYDGKYAVWEQMWPFVATGEYVVDSDEYNEYMKRNHGTLWSKMWVMVAVERNKAQATKYCRSRFGRHCFKENDKVVIAFT